MRGRGLRIAATRKSPLKQDESARHELHLQITAALANRLHPTSYTVTPDYAFAKEAIERGWKWDIALCLVVEKLLLAVEVDGGIWVQGAHAHPTTILRNMEKRNWGARLGWRVVCFTPDEVRNGRALDFVLAVLTNPRQLTVAEQLRRGSRGKTKARFRKPARKRVAEAHA